MSRVIRALLFGSLFACGSPSGPDPSDRLALTAETAHLRYFAAAGDGVDIAWMESYYTWLLPQLAVSTTGTLDYLKYRDREHLRRVTGRRTNGFAEPDKLRFHTIWAIDNHEIVHAVAVQYIGHPPALFNEGIAVAHHMRPAEGVLVPEWNRRHVHQIAAEAVSAGRVPALVMMLESSAFFTHDENLTYPLAGSFVRFLIDEHGIEPLKALLRTSSFDQSAAVTRARFQTAFGRSVDDAWTAWQAHVTGFGAALRPGAALAPQLPQRR